MKRIYEKLGNKYTVIVKREDRRSTIKLTSIESKKVIEKTIPDHVIVGSDLDPVDIFADVVRELIKTLEGGQTNG
jgi:hypothetical protein